MKLSRWLPAAVFFAVAGLFLIAILYGDPSHVPSAVLGKPVPTFDLAPLEGVDRPGLASADFARGEVSVLNVWASWCVPCRQEHPVLMGLAARGVPVYGLNYKDGAQAARRFLEEMGNPYQRIGVDRVGRVAIDWGVYGVPETFVVDGAGRIIFKQVGPLDAETLDQVIWPQIEAARRLGEGGAGGEGGRGD